MPETEPDKFLDELVQDPRIRVRRAGSPARDGQTVVYWMQRSQRGRDSHALDVAIKIGNALQLPVLAYFAGISNFRAPYWRHYAFLNQGLPDIQEDLAERNVTFLLRNAPNESHERLLSDVKAAICIGDENPMREPESWRTRLVEQLTIPFWTVDNDVVVPTSLVGKAQYAAYTLRPRLYRVLPEFLKPYENLKADKQWKMPKGFVHDDPREDMTQNWKGFDRSVKPVDAWKGGRHAAMKRLEHFVTSVLPQYDDTRNQPEVDGSSKLSPYLHFGHISPLTIALAVEGALKSDPGLAKARDGYFNELIVWRELAVNFVQHTPNYDTAECAEPWALQTIADHALDERERTYTLQQLECAETYDELWNAAQIQMVEHGWMHNRLRMYWAKKILEWTPDVATAVRYAVHLNDKYFLDGRDPNGYAGVAWSMLGKFDRPWFERPVFGKIRYMSAVSTGKKFDSKGYIRQMHELREGEFRLR